MIHITRLTCFFAPLAVIAVLGVFGDGIPAKGVALGASFGALILAGLGFALHEALRERSDALDRACL